MINSSFNVTAPNTSSLTTPISDTRSKLEVIYETQNILIDILDIMVKDLEDAFEEAMQDNGAPEEIKNSIKSQIDALIEALKEQKASLQNPDRNEWTRDPKELLKFSTTFFEYLEKTKQRAQNQNDAFKVHDLEQKFEHVSKLQTKLEALD